MVDCHVNLLVEFVVMSVSICSPRVIATLLFQVYIVYTYNWVMLLIVLYDGVMLVRMTWHMDDSSVTTIRDDVMSLSRLYVGYCDK